MRTFKVTGMACSACSAKVEKTVSALNGVESCSVNLLNKSMIVEGDIKTADIINEVKKLGFGIKLGSSTDDEKDDETAKLLKRFLSSIAFLLVLMYISMGHTMYNFPLPNFLTEKPILIGVIQCVLALIVIIINRKFYINGIRAIFKGGTNMDTLVSLGSFASFMFSLVMIITMIGKDLSYQKETLHGLYFESSAMILALITLGKTLESYSKGKTTNALRDLMDLTPKTATVIVDGQEKIIPAKDIKAGDVFIVKPGESVSADGIVLEGESTVDESSLTGESMPVFKNKGQSVYASTINNNGLLKCEATKSSDKTVLAEIIKTVKEASTTKAPSQKLADKVSGIFVPTVISIALVTFLSWLIFGDCTFGYALARGVSVLVISCPCALGLATPVAIMVSSGKGAKEGILFKNAQAIEDAGKINTIALDKTGTITNGKPQVTDIIPHDTTKENLLEIAYSLEKNASHPISLAIVDYCEKNGIQLKEVSDFETYSGKGISGSILNEKAYGGSEKYISEFTALSDNLKEKILELSTQGKTVTLFYHKKLLGIIAVSDTVRVDSKEAIKALKDMNIKVVMVTGDNNQTAAYIGKEVGVDTIIAEVMPKEKSQVINQLKTQGKVAMVGDGINDAVALTSADVGIAIGSGTDIAINSSQIVLTKNSLLDVVKTIKLSRKTLRIIKQNLFWAFFYNLLCIPVATGMFATALGWELNPMLGALAMGLSSIFVVTNALRIGKKI